MLLRITNIRNEVSMKFKELVRKNQIQNIERKNEKVEELRREVLKTHKGWGSGIKGTSSLYRDQMLYEYLRANQGVTTNIRKISEDLGYHSPQGARARVIRMLEEGKLTVKKGQGSNYRFYLTELGSAKKLNKGDERNGDVVITHVAAKPSVPTAPSELKEEVKQTETPILAESSQKTNEQTFVEILDLAIWEFLKTYDPKDAQYKNTALGEVTQGLREFSIYMKNRAIKENTNEEKNEQRP